MRGVSAEGFATSLERLEGLAAEGDAGRLGRELFQITRLVGSEAALRRALTDPSAVSEAKDGLARAVFDEKVSPDAVEVLATAAAARWSSSADFIDALEQLGATSLVIEAEKAGRLSELEDELFRFGRLVLGTIDLRDAITNKQVPGPNRQALVEGLLQGKASDPAVSLAGQAVVSRHRSFDHALEYFQKIAADRQRRLVALVRTAVPLNDDERARLAAALASQYGRGVHLNVVVDPRVIGGLLVELGDDIIDGTVAGRLDDARRRMVG